MAKLNQTEKAILELLQADCQVPLAEIAAAVNLSPTPCWRRIQKLKKEGILRSSVALLDPEKVNAAVTVFVSIRLGQHNATWLRDFSKSVIKLPQVMEFYRMSGDVDLLLRIVVPDIKGYDQIYQQLMALARKLSTHGGTFDVSSSFALEQVKYTTELPLNYA